LVRVRVRVRGISALIQVRVRVRVRFTVRDTLPTVTGRGRVRGFRKIKRYRDEFPQKCWMQG
jgi:hypothetical protein